MGVVLVTGAELAWNTGVVLAQKSQAPERNADPIMPPASQPGVMTSEDPSIGGRMGQDRIEAMKMADRHNHAQKDIEKMVALTNELQAGFAKTNQGDLPLDLVKKAKEVEKLAHDLQTQINH
jgi:hypothetical protein